MRHHDVPGFGLLGDHRSIEQLRRMDDDGWSALLDELLPPRDARGFATVCHLFASWPAGPARSERLDRTVQGMAGLDDALRALTSSYMGMYDGTRLSDVARLARSIDVYRREDHGSSELEAIATSEHVTGLVRLTILRSEVSSRAWKALVESPHLHGLRELAVQRTSLGSADIDALFRSRSLPELRTLALVEAGLRVRDLHLLEQSVLFARLESVDLSCNALATDGAVLLAGAPWLARVGRITLCRNHIRRAGIEALLRSPHLRASTVLDVRDNLPSWEDPAPLGALAVAKGIDLAI